MVYYVPEHLVPETLAYLDHREKGGYSRHTVTVWNIDAEGEEIVVVPEALLYIATEENEEYLGPDDLKIIAEQIHQSHGPSGPNVEYLLNLATALEGLSVVDQHVIDLASLVTEMSNKAVQEINEDKSNLPTPLQD
mmetsp:Transcript_20797/g.26303  ORF Transcript_20797/g.26303 Transcript_20797/m.26303 type:complete len:136 (-) Transcript_20797:29-436(-)